MGNCAPKPNKTSSKDPSPSVVRLYGPASCPVTSMLRVALLYKAVTIQFCPSSENGPTLECGPDTVTGPTEAILRYINSKLPGPSILVGEEERRRGSAMPGVALAAALQHRSMERHVERMVKWAEELVARGGQGGEEYPAWRGSPRMEARRFRRSYSQLLELMLEHAQMEERVLFPVLERADTGFCKTATEEHARDLPIMNGIKEDIKSIVVLEAGSPIYQEALLNLSTRLNTLQEHCRGHFAEEERELLPLLEVAERSGGEGGKEEEAGVMGKLMQVMEGSHSHLFHFLIAGLHPQEAMQYIDIVCSSCDRQRVVTMLRSLAAKMEGAAATLSIYINK